MSDTKNVGIGTALIVPILFGVLAFALTGDLQAGAIIFCIFIIYNMSTLLSLIPILGWFAQFYVMEWISDKMMYQVPANIEWIEQFAFALYLVIGFAVTLIMAVAFVSWIWPKRGDGNVASTM